MHCSILRTAAAAVAVTTVGIATLPTSANATTISFGTADLATSTSTTTTTSFGGLLPVPSLPDDSTFTLPFSGTLLGLQGKFWRFEFVLPDDFTALSFSLAAKVNDEMAIFLNDTVVAVQDDTANVNFDQRLMTYFLQLNADGTVTDVPPEPPAGFPVWNDWNDPVVLSQTLFHPGVNELTIFGVDTCCVSSSAVGGSLSVFEGEISYRIASDTPEPGTLSLLALELAGAGLLRRRLRL